MVIILNVFTKSELINHNRLFALCKMIIPSLRFSLCMRFVFRQKRQSRGIYPNRVRYKDTTFAQVPSYLIQLRLYAGCFQFFFLHVAYRFDLMRASKNDLILHEFPQIFTHSYTHQFPLDKIHIIKPLNLANQERTSDVLKKAKRNEEIKTVKNSYMIYFG